MIVAVNRGNHGFLFDAHGVIIQRATSADTVSGEVNQLVRKDGHYVIEFDEAVIEVVTYDAPLKFLSRAGGFEPSVTTARLY